MQLIDAAPLKHFPQPLKLRWQRRVLHFKRPAWTSRGALTERVTYIIEANGAGLGECCVMPGLLPELTEQELNYWCTEAERLQRVPDAPSPIRFGLECALLAALRPGSVRWDTAFARGEAGVPIHHLIWMADIDTMLAAAQRGIETGFTCLKMKVGALPFSAEVDMLRAVHAAYPQAEIRVDANGAFAPDTAFQRLEALAEAGVSCIEQPIRPNQWAAMAELCRHSPLPVALDEELIHADCRILDTINPAAIVIKPSLHGGLMMAQRWAEEAETRGIRWWVNSALESHVGLTALAEWCAYVEPGKMHGLGTGQLFADDAAGAVRLVGNSLQMQKI